MSKRLRFYEVDRKESLRLIVSALNDEMRPIHYREAYSRFSRINPSLRKLSENTDGAEKLRQWFSESSRDVVVWQGYLLLSDWLTESKDLLYRKDVDARILTATEREDCAYEIGRRYDHMIIKFKNSGDEENRRRRILVEKSVSLFFANAFPEFFRKPSNDGVYTMSCDHDFSLAINSERKVMFDVKEFTRETTSVLTNDKPTVYYIYAEWEETHAKMLGFIRGSDAENLDLIPARRYSAKEVKYSDLSSISTIFAAWNAIKVGFSLVDVRNDIDARGSLRAA